MKKMRQGKKVLLATDTDKVDVPSVANKKAVLWVQLSEIKTMFNKAAIKLERKRDFQVAGMAEKTVIDAVDMYAIEGQYGHVRSAVPSAIPSVVGDVLDERVVAEHTQKSATRAVVHPSIIKAVFDTLLKKDDMAPIATFVANYVEKEFICVKKEKKLPELRRKIHMLQPSPPTSDPSDNDDKPSRDKKKGALFAERRAQ